MKKGLIWMLTAILLSGLSMSGCATNSNATTIPTSLSEWKAGNTVTEAEIKAYGGLDKCFAAEPIPDGVWQRMQGKTYKENPHIGRNNLRHIRALHWGL